jgi:Protein of unknown function (DUF742)
MIGDTGSGDKGSGDGGSGDKDFSELDGRVVPAYALTRGRTRSLGQDLPLEAVVTATEAGLLRLSSLQAERRMIVELCAGPTSVAEIAAHLRIPVGVARVLVGDLASSGYLAVHPPPNAGGERPDAAILQRLLDGLRAR